MNRGDVYVADLEPTRGREQRGRRPVVVISHTRFNHLTELPVILPITNGGGFARRSGFAVPLVGTLTTGIIRCDQPRVIDLGDRKAHYIETLPEALVIQALARVRAIFD